MTRVRCPACGTVQTGLRDGAAVLLRVHRTAAGTRCPASLTEVRA